MRLPGYSEKDAPPNASAGFHCSSQNIWSEKMYGELSQGSQVLPAAAPGLLTRPVQCPALPVVCCKLIIPASRDLLSKL